VGHPTLGLSDPSATPPHEGSLTARLTLTIDRSSGQTRHELTPARDLTDVAIATTARRNIVPRRWQFLGVSPEVHVRPFSRCVFAIQRGHGSRKRALRRRLCASRLDRSRKPRVANVSGEEIAIW
jgi:hypothetical protein